MNKSIYYLSKEFELLFCMSSWFIMTVFFRIKEIKVDDKEEFIQQGDGGGQ